MEEMEIDLRKYVQILLRRWKWIAGATVGAALGALVISFLIRPTYEASAYVAASKLKVEVQFGSQIRTLTEEELAAAGAQAMVNREARLATFRELATSPAIASEVIPQFADRLRAIDPDLLDPSRFLEHVRSEQRTKSDLIVITVSLPDPKLAADIANAWAQAYERHVNGLYSSARPQDVDVLEAQTEQARKAYQAAQAELEKYLSNNPIPRLKREIETIQTIINSYQDAVVKTESLVNTSEFEVRRNLLSGYYSDWVMIEKMLDDVQTLYAQVRGQRSPAANFGDALAIIFARARASGGARTEMGSPFSLQLQTPLSAEPVTASDVAALIEVLEERKAKTEAKIKELTAELLIPPRYSLPAGAGEDVRRRLEELTAQLQSYQAQLEAESAHQKDLERQRDLAWETYTQLAKKLAEVQVAAQTSGSEVRVASLAVPPHRPASPRKLLNTAVGGVLGWMLAVLGVFIAEWWRTGVGGLSAPPNGSAASQ